MLSHCSPAFHPAKQLITFLKVITLIKSEKLDALIHFLKIVHKINQGISVLCK